MKILAGLLTGLLLTSSSIAATLAYSYVIPEQKSDVLLSGNLGYFDSSIGNLTNVSLTFSASKTTTAINFVGAGGGSTLNFDFTENTILSLTSSLTPLDAVVRGISKPDTTLITTTGLLSINQLVNYSLGPYSDSFSLTLDSELDSFLTSFIGNGDFNISCESSTGYSRSGDINYIYVYSLPETKVGCSASVVYTYDAAGSGSQLPEPATFPLLALGLLAFRLQKRGKES